MEEYVKKCIENAENLVSKLPDEIISMEGMCGNKTRHFYNNLLEHCPGGARYLEIGTWMGTSLCSAMYGNKSNIICIDNFCQFSGPKEQFLQNLEKYKGENNVTFIEENCWSVDPIFKEKINVYLYDGGHEYIDHYRALVHYYRCLDDTFVFVVDDWNWKPTRDGTFDSIRDLGLDVIFKHEIRLTDDDTHTPPWGNGRQTWHNGIGVFILSKKKCD